MSLKTEFVRRATAPNANVSALCREFNIARETGHKWIERFREQGYDGLEERSRRPRSTPLATGEDLVVAIVESREAHPTWGPHKLHVMLQRRFGTQTPTERTVARVLSRFDKIRKRKRRPPVNIVTQAPNVVVSTPNDLWTVEIRDNARVTSGVTSSITSALTRRCETRRLRNLQAFGASNAYTYCRVPEQLARAQSERQWTRSDCL